jgi:DNA topoisomerase VI subunit A
MAFDSARLACPSAEWIGIKIADWTRYDVEQDQLRRLSGEDVRKSISILKRGDLPGVIRRELQVMLHTGYKSEIQCLSVQDMCERFLADKCV